MKFLKKFLLFTLFFSPLAQGYYHNGSIWHKRDSGDQFIIPLGEIHEGNKGHREQLLKIICDACDKYNIDKNDILVVVEDMTSFNRSLVRDAITRKNNPFVHRNQLNAIVDKAYPRHDITALCQVAESYQEHGIRAINAECRSRPKTIDVRIENTKIIINGNVVADSNVRCEYSCPYWINNYTVDLSELPILSHIAQNYNDGPILNSFYEYAKIEMNLHKEKLKEIHNSVNCGESHQQYNNEDLRLLLMDAHKGHVDIEIGHALHTHPRKKFIFILAGSAHTHMIENNLLGKLGYKKIHQGGDENVVVNGKIGAVALTSRYRELRGLPPYVPVLNLKEFFDSCPYDIFKTTFAPRSTYSWFSNSKKLIVGMGAGLALAAVYLGWYRK